MSGPCTPWIEEDEDLVECGCPDGQQLVVQSAIITAVDILYNLSGRRWSGVCQETKRPCQSTGGCSCSDFHLCYCIGGDQIELPRTNVTSVDAILIDGQPFTDFLFYSPNWLVRTDGDIWPCCQDLTLPSTADGTWAVTYSYGVEPTEGAKNAARVLTTELVKACVGEASCRIPVGAVSVTKRGVTYDLSANDGFTGITEIDMWLKAVNPKGRRQRARLISPDDTRWIPEPIVGS
ncbi:MAG: hypothetical protein GY906_10435 [bacterium]|nr:hypothetical protein [bacterium]